ncbi:MAG: NADH-quinone oxidoreductase subunit N [bacterium]
MNSVGIVTQDLVSFAPTLVLAALAFLMLIFGMFFPRMYRETLAAIVLIGFAVAMFITIQNWSENATIFNGMISADKFTAGFTCLFIISAGLTLLLSLNSLEGSSLLSSEFFALIIFATIGMILMAASTHLLALFLGVETLSVSLYILAGFRRDDKFSLEASFKYFLLGAFASGFLLYGIALVYGGAGSASLSALSEALSAGGANPASSPTLLTTGLVLMVVGFGFKIALVPFHAWAPDVYQGAPTPISAFMATGSKAAGFAALMRVVLNSGIMNNVDWQQVFWMIAVATMTVGNIVALRQENIKRLLAYSSIAHAGYILIGILANNELGSSAVLFYLLSYTFMNVGAFGVVALMAHGDREYVELKNFRGLAYRRPLAAVAMSIFMFSLAGIPITAGFISKFYVFLAAMQSGFLWLVILGVINSMISLYYYLGVVVTMFMHKPEGEEAGFEPLPAVALALGIAAFGTIQLGLSPAKWMETFQDLARSVM